MKVLLLASESEECRRLERALVSDADVALLTDRIAPDRVREHAPELIVSYNYRFILPAAAFSAPALGTINLHISYLPWNRGADPNFWSHAEGTPKGVSIHYIDAGIDTGDLIAQRAVAFSGDDTLRTSYAKLHAALQTLFHEVWPRLKGQDAARLPQRGPGTFHRSVDRRAYEHVLRDRGWDTPLREVTALGLDHAIIHGG